MKKWYIVVIFLITVVAEAAIVFSLTHKIKEVRQDTVSINRCIKAIEKNYGKEDLYPTDMEYSIIDGEENLIWQNGNGISTSINDAIKNNDTILDLETGSPNVAKVIFKNTTYERIEEFKKEIVIYIIIVTIIQVLLLLFYLIYLMRTIITPFNRMKDFAVRVAGGNLDLPLTMDKGNIFGGFTESFDLMRSELKKSRIAEKKAYDDKNELVAKLSHDIKTPVASIKSTSEIGYELTKEEKTKELFNTMNFKSDQITTLVDNLFNSSVNEITEISVSPSEQPSDVITTAIKNADYMKKAGSFDIPTYRIFVDKLRLQQAFDNVFMNSYKYADTPITVTTELEEEYLKVTVSDTGAGVKKEELPLLKEKYKRGSNVSERDGAGLGLFLTDYFITAMNGRLEFASDGGFSVCFFLRLA
ncbi:MAG: HAMP domain-containing histidine kinase [Eubacterium sp.]|nr:HAMP domain-containing histidine kinase [Eubacterium sp.]